MPSFHLLADTGLAGELLGALFFERFPFLDCWVVRATGSHSIDFETSGFGVRTIAKFLNHWLGDGTIAKFSFAVICPDPGKILNPGHCGREGLKS